MTDLLDSVIEQIERELPGFRWSLTWDGVRVRCVLTSPDFKSHVWEAGGKTTEDIESGIRVTSCSHDRVRAVRRAIEIAKDKMR
jgi:hypothetical protein